MSLRGTQMTRSVKNGETSAMLRMMQWTGLLVFASLTTGCAHTCDVADDCLMKWRCCHEAKMAWVDTAHLYSDVAYPFDFGQGFRAGYQSICMGGDGCRPPMPPRTYWSHHYQCDEGRCQIMAWYDGYHHGALAAQCNGCEGRCNVLCAGELYGQKPCSSDYKDLEHRVVPENEMPGHVPMDMHYDMPLETPPAPAVPEHGVPMAPEGVYGVGSPTVPTEPPGRYQIFEPGIDATIAPSF